MEQDQQQSHDNLFVELIQKATEKELDDAVRQFNFPVPGQGAKADVLFNSIGVFTSKGIEDTTVQDLLDAANISRRTFYKYFKNKVEVLESIYQIAAELLMARFRAVKTQSASVSEFVVQCVELFFDYHANLGPLIRMMTEEALRADSPLAPHRATLLEHMVKLFDDRYFEEEGVRLDPKVYYSLIWMMESASMNILTTTPCTREVVDSYKAVMCSISARAMVSDPSQWESLPRLPTRELV
ncbi:MAG TPA: TetR/AcrR family transcriptional regulator [Candidatus Kapabacteria bacterium]|nr:TetR/AcrR family transcriptional regulator [Candidatus Kapabacteria bacterium]